jgi:hypothetical protein
MTWIIGLVLAVIVIVAFLLFAWWGIPFLIAGAVVFGLIALAGARKAEQAEPEEPIRQTEPTGTTGAARGGAETANERVGQG